MSFPRLANRAKDETGSRQWSGENFVAALVYLDGGGWLVIPTCVAARSKRLFPEDDATLVGFVARLRALPTPLPMAAPRSFTSTLWLTAPPIIPPRRAHFARRLPFTGCTVLEIDLSLGACRAGQGIHDDAIERRLAQAGICRGRSESACVFSSAIAGCLIHPGCGYMPIMAPLACYRRGFSLGSTGL